MEYVVKVNITNDDKVKICKIIWKNCLERSSFDVTAVDKIYKMHGIDTYGLEIHDNFLRPLHCVDWGVIKEQGFYEKIQACVAPFLKPVAKGDDQML